MLDRTDWGRQRAHPLRVDFCCAVTAQSEARPSHVEFSGLTHKDDPTPLAASSSPLSDREHGIRVSGLFVLAGSTTPAIPSGQQPFGFFRQNLVSEYTYPQSVADGVSGQRSILIAKVTPCLL